MTTDEHSEDIADAVSSARNVPGEAEALSEMQARLAAATTEAEVVAIEIEACEKTYPSVLAACPDRRRALSHER